VATHNAAAAPAAEAEASFPPFRDGGFVLGSDDGVAGHGGDEASARNMQAYRSLLLLLLLLPKWRKEETHHCFLGGREKKSQGLEPTIGIHRDCAARRHCDDRTGWEIPCFVVVLLVVLAAVVRLYGLLWFSVFRCFRGACRHYC